MLKQPFFLSQWTNTEILRQHQKEMVKTKNSVPDIKNAFERLISTQNMAEQRINESEDMSMELPRPKYAKKKKGTEYLKTVGQLKKLLTHKIY